MTRYISEPVAVDRGSVRGEMETSLTTNVPGLEIPAGTLLDYLIDTFSGTTANDRQLFTEQLAIIFRYSGEKIDRVTQRDAVSATGLTEWARTSDDEVAVGARVVTAGTEITVTGLDGEPVAFRTVEDFTFPDGTLTVSDVEITAVLAGEDGNGLQAGAQPAETTTWLDTVTVTTATSGGVNAEADEDYLDRLSDTRPLQLNAIATGDDLARWLRNQTGVSRAMGLDNYDTGPDTPGHIKGVPVDENGDALTSPEMTVLQAAAQEITLTNLSVHIAAPTYTTVTVVFVGVAKSGWDASDVETRAEEAVLDYLDRSRWGLPEQGDERLWTEKTTVRFQDLVTVLNNVEGFDYYTSLTINGSTSDLTITGPGALPKSDSTASGTVTAP